MEGPPAKVVPTPRSVATGTPKAKAKAAPPPYAGYLTPAQQAAQAAAQARAAQLPESQAITANAAASAAAAKAQAGTVQGYYDALAGILKGVAPAVQSGYQSAAGSTDAFAKGFSDGLAHVQTQAGGQTDSVLAASGGQVQGAQANAALGGTAAQDALYSTGYIPATNLLREGAAANAAAVNLPGSVATQGADRIVSIGKQQTLDQAGFAKQRTDLAAQIPGLRQTAQNRITTQQNQLLTTSNKAAVDKQAAADRKTALQIAYIRTTETNPDGTLTVKGKKDLASIAQANAKVQQGAARVQIAANNSQLAAAKAGQAAADKQETLAIQRARITGVYQGNPIPGFKYTPAGKVVKTSTVKKPGGMTQNQWTVIYGKVNKQADDLYHGVGELTNSAGQVTRPAVDAVLYQDAFAQIKTTHPTMSNRKIYAILNLYYKPGDGGGRPQAYGAAGSPYAGPPSPGGG